jgi:DNA-binding NtrC family response regulator
VETEGSFHCFEGMITKSPKLAAVFDRVRRLGPSPWPMLITGPTGAGKELIARAVHATSRVRGPFIAVNAGALAPSLIEAELFGHARGAFTGADADRSGLFEAADRGTLFLDEIAELPLDLQPRLLRILETGSVRRIGDAIERAIEVRVVAATHADLEHRVAQGRFREDLLHRLRILTIEIPPLADRREDVVPLAEHFLACTDRDSPGLTPEAKERLLLHAWPGNVRELRNVIMRAALLARGRPIRAEDLELDQEPKKIRSERRLEFRDLSTQEQKALLLETLEACENNRSRAARHLGISRSTLHERLRRLGWNESLNPVP